MHTDQRARMLAGELYFANDPELVAARLHAQQQLAEFNGSPPDAQSLRRQLLASLFGQLGEDVTIMPSLRCDYGFNIFIGRNTFMNYDCVLLDCNRIEIGADVQIAPGVHIYTATHPLDPVTRKSGAEAAHPVTIEDNVWLGGRSVVCPGVTIGANTVVAAGSVVTKSLPANVLAAGSPCRPIRPL